MAEHNMGGQDDAKLEQILDGLLSKYSAADPRQGLESRVLANLRIQNGRRPQGAWVGFLLWGGAAAVVAALVLITVFSRTGGQKRVLRTEKPRIEVQDPSNQVKSATRQEFSHAAGGSSRVHRAAVARKIPNEGGSSQDLPIAQRPAIFPTPVALTEQERQMFAYLENTPKEDVIAQIPTEDPREAQVFWEDHEPATRPQRLTNNR